MKNNRNIKIINWLALTAIILIAFFLRFYNIENVPAGVYPDEATNGTDALLANETGNYKWFYTNNYGREGLFMNLIAFAIKFFGPTVLGLKIWSIIFGTLTVLGTFLLSKELFKGSWRAGLISAYLTAFSFWAINFSRISFRAIMLPAVLVFSFYFFFRGLRTRHYWHFLLSGLIFGIGLHTYIAFRIAPAIFVVLFFGLLLTKERLIGKYWKQAIVFVVAIFISAAPILWDFYQHPEYFQSRSSSISVFSPEVNRGRPLQTLLKSVGLSLVKFNFYGDQNWRHNYPPYPVLHPAVGLSFLVGIIYLIGKFFHLAILRLRHGVRDEKLYIYLFLLAWFFIMLAPEFLTEEGLPHALRSIGTLPAVYIIATIPILWLLGKRQEFSHTLKSSIVPILIITLAFVGIFNTLKYHVFWANNPQQHGAFNENYKNMARYLNSLPAGTHKYVLANGEGRDMEDGLPVSAQVIKFLGYDKDNSINFTRETEKIVLEKPSVLVMMRYDQGIADNLKKKYPEIEEQRIDLTPGFGNSFISIVIK